MSVTFGEKAGRNNKVLEESVVFTFPSVLVLLPTLEEYKDESVGFIANNRGIVMVFVTLTVNQGERVLVDFFDPQNWQRYGIGFAANKHLDEKEIDFLRKSLQDALKAKVLYTYSALRSKEGMRVPNRCEISSSLHPRFAVISFTT